MVKLHTKVHLLFARYGFELVADRNFQHRDDAVGLRGASPYAQLLTDGRVAHSGSIEMAALYSILHELAHGLEGPAADELHVFVRQEALLVELSQL